MHLVAKQIKGREYFYLVEKGRRAGKVVTTRTVYVGDRRKLVETIHLSASSALPSEYAPQPVGAVLAMASVAADLGIEQLIDHVCPVRGGAAPVGRRLLIAAVHRVLAPRGENGLTNLARYHQGTALGELLPIDLGALDDRRMCELLSSLSAEQVDKIEAAVVERLVAREAIATESLAFDCTNFDSYAGAKSRSRLLRRGHAKSGRPLRVLGLGLLATADDGMPLVTFTYPGNENDQTAFKRFLRALDRRRASLRLPLEATVAADGGNVNKQLLLGLEKDPRYYVMRLPPHHLGKPARLKRGDLPSLMGSLKGKVWAKKFSCPVYGLSRTVTDVYSRRMHLRQLPGLGRDRRQARSELEKLQRLLTRQRQGLRRHRPLTVKSVRARVVKALAREHMDTLFHAKVHASQHAPVLTVREPEQAWRDLEDYVLGRTLLVTNRTDWTPEQIVMASRIQSHNERAFRDLKKGGGASMEPLRHRRDQALRSHAMLVMLGLMLAKVVQRRVKKAGVSAPSLASVLGPLKTLGRAKVSHGPDAPPALRALAASVWVPERRSERQAKILTALGLGRAVELGTTLLDKLTPARFRDKNAAGC